MYQTLRCALISIVRLNPWSDSLSKQLAKRSKQLALRRCNMHYGHDNIQKIKTFSTNFIRPGGTRSLDYLTISQTPYPSVVTKHKLRRLQISLLVYIDICLWQIQAGNAAVRLAAGLPSESRRARASKLSQMSTPPLSGPGPTDLVPAPTVAWVSWIISDSLQLGPAGPSKPAGSSVALKRQTMASQAIFGDALVVLDSTLYIFAELFSFHQWQIMLRMGWLVVRQIKIPD